MQGPYTNRLCLSSRPQILSMSIHQFTTDDRPIKICAIIYQFIWLYANAKPQTAHLFTRFFCFIFVGFYNLCFIAAMQFRQINLTDGLLSRPYLFVPVCVCERLCLLVYHIYKYQSSHIILTKPSSTHGL